MKTKFKQSDISISGIIKIEVLGDRFYDKDIEINGSKGKTKSGVYELVNKLNGKRYIGQARNLENRYNRHMRDLKVSEHCNDLIYGDFNDFIKNRPFGFVCNPNDLFEFRVIIYCRPSELTFWEHILIENLHPEYNIKKEKEISLSEEFLNTEGENDRLEGFTYPDPGTLIESIPDSAYDIDENWEEIK